MAEEQTPIKREITVSPVDPPKILTVPELKTESALITERAKKDTLLQQNILAEQEQIKPVLQLLQDGDLTIEEALVLLAPRSGEMRTNSDIDALTGLPNRRASEIAMLQQIALALRSGQPLTVGFGDIDHFKIVNDTIGHAGGDAVLRAASEQMRESLRATDIIGRFGGEEFIFLFPNSTEAQVLERLEEVRTSVPEAVKEALIGGIGASLEHPVTLSMGITEIPSSVLRTKARVFDVYTELLRIADARLYEAKGNGRNMIVGSAAKS